MSETTDYDLAKETALNEARRVITAPRFREAAELQQTLEGAIVQERLNAIGEALGDEIMAVGHVTGFPSLNADNVVTFEVFTNQYDREFGDSREIQIPLTVLLSDRKDFTAYCARVKKEYEARQDKLVKDALAADRKKDEAELQRLAKKLGVNVQRVIS